jgi:hypothetical protein
LENAGEKQGRADQARADKAQALPPAETDRQAHGRAEQAMQAQDDKDRAAHWQAEHDRQVQADKDHATHQPDDQ